MIYQLAQHYNSLISRLLGIRILDQIEPPFELVHFALDLVQNVLILVAQRDALMSLFFSLNLILKAFDKNLFRLII